MHLLPGRDRRRRLEDNGLRIDLAAGRGKVQIDTGSIGALAVADSNPDVVWAGTGRAAIRSNVIAIVLRKESLD